MAHEVYLERLLGVEVRELDGAKVGRIEEVRTTEQDGDCVIEDFLVGGAAWLERLSVRAVQWLGLKWLARWLASHGYVVPWDQLDLSDPEHPRLRCSREHLQRIENYLTQPLSKR